MKCEFCGDTGWLAGEESFGACGCETGEAVAAATEYEAGATLPPLPTFGTAGTEYQPDYDVLVGVLNDIQELCEAYVDRQQKLALPTNPDQITWPPEARLARAVEALRSWK